MSPDLAPHLLIGGPALFGATWAVLAWWTERREAHEAHEAPAPEPWAACRARDAARGRPIATRP